MRALTIAAVLASSVPIAASAAPETSLRCEGGLVAVGDATIDLLGKCGAPALREPRRDATSIATRAGDTQVKRTVLVSIERWSYDFGPRRFVMYVTLEDGRVSAIERGGYGYAKADAPRVAVRRATCDASAIRSGDSTLDLRARCGEPAVVDYRPASDVILAADPGSAVVAARASEVQLEVWTYDFGPQAFVRRAVLENGVVTRVETGGHGYAR